MASYRSSAAVPRRQEQAPGGTQNPSSKHVPFSRIPASRTGAGASTTAKPSSTTPNPSSSKLSRLRFKTEGNGSGKPTRSVTASSPGSSSKISRSSIPSKMVSSTKSSTYPPITTHQIPRQLESDLWGEIPLAPHTRFEPTRTPSLASGSSASTQDSPNSNLIRRKELSMGRVDSRFRSGSLSSRDDGRQEKQLIQFSDPFPDSVLGITLPTSPQVLTRMSPAIANPHDGHDGPSYPGPPNPARLATVNLSPSPFYSLPSVSPSTGYTDSPGVFSAGSTPTSVSSYSPGTHATALGLAITPNIRPERKIKSRPPVTRRRGTANDDDGLSSVRESTSSSSTCTIRAPESTKTQDPKLTRRLSTPPPSPPIQKPSIPPVVTRAKTAPEYIQTTSLTMSPTQLPRPPFNKTAPLNPPEFAHLAAPPSIPEPSNEGSPIKSASRPQRPSRDGTPDISSLREASPIIQSNLTHLPSQTHRRRSSSDSRSQSAGPPPAAFNTPRTRFGFASKASSRNPSPSPSNSSKVSIAAPSYGSVGGLKTPDLSESEHPTSTRLRRPSAGSTTSASPGKGRFGFFRRKTEPAMTVASTQPIKLVEPVAGKDRKLRKGPAAGTGHEGYGRYGQSTSTRGRSGSTTSGTNSAGSVGRSASAGSQTSRKSSTDAGPQIDEFLSSRIAPRTLRGQGAIGSADRKDSASSQESVVGKHSTPKLQPLLMDQGTPEFADLARKRTSISNGLSGLASRRMSRRSQLIPDSSTSNPAPISVAALTRSPIDPALGSATSRAESNESTHSRNWFRRKGSDAQSEAGQLVQTQQPPPKSTKKWNFFQRTMGASAAAASSPRRDGSITTPSIVANGDAVVFPIKYSLPRTVAHYAMADASVPDRIDMIELENIMREADLDGDSGSQENGTETEPWIQSLDSSIAQEKERRDRGINEAAYTQSILLPPLPSLPSDLSHGRLQRPASPKVILRRDQSPAGPTESGPTMGAGALLEPASRGDSPRTTSVSPVQSFPNDGGNRFERMEQQPHVVPQQRSRSRLPQVGRIPQVVSRRDRQLAPSTQSFSRPFVSTAGRAEMSPSLQQMATMTTSTGVGFSGELYPGQPALTTAPPAIDLSASQLHPHPFDSAFGILPLHQRAINPPVSHSKFPFAEGEEFLRFSVRHNSETSTDSTSTSGAISIPVALIPPKGAPATEDEVWTEYYDFLEDVAASRHPRTPGTGSSLGAPFHYHDLVGPDPACTTQGLTFMPNLNPKNAGNGLIRPIPPQQHPQLPPPPQARPPQVQLPSIRPLDDLSRLSVVTPTTPLSITDFLNAYGDRNTRSSLGSPSHERFASATKRGVGAEDCPAVPGSGSIRIGSLVRGLRESQAVYQSPLLSPASPGSDRSSFSQPSQPTKARLRAQLPSTKSRDSRTIAIAQKDDEEGGSIGNILFGALMTSKWLSFGRVLFSPAHFEVQERRENRVLILDGLGKDWSYYVAMTYPNAAIYSLGPDPSVVSPKSPNAAGQSPPNHRHIHHPHPSAPFPFPRGFFTCAVFRFPRAIPDSAYSTALAECKRVLQPGGYLEVFALDLDLLNMGNRARRAVRGLKERMQFAQPGVSLKPVADNLVRCIGRRGFESLQRCVVGVPISGPITRSSDESGSGEEHDSEDKCTAAKTETKADESVRSSALDDADADITKMVPRVGRWWYSQCYESTASPIGQGTGHQSIWEDRSLLRECERRGTNFRLLICYAQKPMLMRRRTVSV